MIVGNIEHLERYEDLSDEILTAIRTASKCSTEGYETGREDLDGDRIYMIKNAYVTHDVSTAQLEAHRKYIDVMVMLEGEECIYVKDTGKLSRITTPYNEEQDYLLAVFDEDAKGVHIKAGDFIILYPEDAHAPGCNAKDSSDVKKIVTKVLI